MFLGFPHCAQLAAFSSAISAPQKGHFGLLGGGAGRATGALATTWTALRHFGHRSPVKSSLDPAKPQFWHLMPCRSAPQYGQRTVSLLTCFPHRPQL
jgi:hypothetical protein